MASFDWEQFEKEAEAGGFSPVPEGTYNVKVATAEAKTAKTGSDMLTLKFEVEDGDEKGKTFFDNLVFHPNAASMTMQSLRALGIGSDVTQQQPSFERLAKMVEGQRAVVKVEVDDSYDGTPRNDVQGVYKPPADGQQNTPAVDKNPETTGAGGGGDDKDEVPF